MMRKNARFKLLVSLVLGLAMGSGSFQLAASGGEPGDFPVDPPGVGPGDGGDQSPGRIKDIEERFETSLHNTRKGKETYYSADDGFFQLTHVPYDTLPCKDCHNKSAFPDWEEPVCLDCHLYAEDDPPDYAPPNDATCLGCHGRQNAEHNLFKDEDGEPIDVHSQLEMACMDCHVEEEVHGDGTEYLSMRDPGVFKISCSDAGCHQDVLEGPGGSEPTADADSVEEILSRRASAFHWRHLETVDCAACHAESVISCDSCHFDTEVAGAGKRYYRQIPQTGFKLLLNHHGKVRTASYQSLTWGTSDLDTSGEPAGEDVEDVAFYVLAPYSTHTITEAENLRCRDCHVVVRGNNPDNLRVFGNAALKEYLSTGYMTVSQWDEETGMLLAPQGVIPVPPDWEDALLFDFAYYLGEPTDPVVKDPEGTTWDHLEPETVGMHMPYGTPLTEEQMDRLQFGGGQNP
ncbi:MAG: hypothetical protein U9Q81_27445 [Pseudomonadota bacterium]|nr:hypothetical protein [Pseudomonadota bacterium]